MSDLAANGSGMQTSVKVVVKPSKVISSTIPKLDLSLLALGERVRLHPNSVRMLLSEEITSQEKDMIKGSGGWSKILEPLLTNHVSEALVHDVTRICVAVNLVPGQFLLKQGLHAKSVFIVVSGSLRMLSLGVPGVEPLHSSRAISARSSFTAQQQEKAFGALVDNSTTSRPSASFTSEEHVFRVANIGPGQLLGEECFSDKKIIQFSVVSDSFATVLSVPFDTLTPMLSKERFSALSTMCLNTLALRAQRAVSGCSWYQSRRMESQRFKLTTKPIEILRSGTRNSSNATISVIPNNFEDDSHLASSAPAYPINTNSEGYKIVQEQLMVCVLSAAKNSAKPPQISNVNHSISFDSGLSHNTMPQVDVESAASRNQPTNPEAVHGLEQPQQSARPWASHRHHLARRRTNLELGQVVLPSQSQAGHSVSCRSLKPFQVNFSYFYRRICFFHAI
jgi:CRP-like cAMP-binding protein